MSLEDLGLSTRVISTLEEAGLHTAQHILDVLSRGEKELLAISGVGEKTSQTIQEQLDKKGLSKIKDEAAPRADQAGGEVRSVPISTENAVETIETEAEAKTPAAVEEMAVPAPTVEEGEEQRISFVVRLTVDERGEPRRTEIEHAQSGKKETFPALNVGRLSAFMKSCIRPPAVEERPMPSGPLAISEVQVFRPHFPDKAVAHVDPDEPFVMQADFQLQSSDAESLAMQHLAFEMKIYAHEVTSGRSTLIGQYRQELMKDVLQYSPQVEASGLSSGIYRLVTLITVPAPINIGGYHEGPILRVGEVTGSHEAAAVSHQNPHL